MTKAKHNAKDCKRRHYECICCGRDVHSVDKWDVCWLCGRHTATEIGKPCRFQVVDVLATTVWLRYVFDWYGEREPHFMDDSDDIRDRLLDR